MPLLPLPFVIIIVATAVLHAIGIVLAVHLLPTHFLNSVGCLFVAPNIPNALNAAIFVVQGTVVIVLTVLHCHDHDT